MNLLIPSSPFQWGLGFPCKVQSCQNSIWVRPLFAEMTCKIIHLRMSLVVAFLFTVCSCCYACHPTAPWAPRGESIRTASHINLIYLSTLPLLVVSFSNSNNTSKPNKLWNDDQYLGHAPQNGVKVKAKLICERNPVGGSSNG